MKLSFEFDTKKEMEKYLKEHPAADKSKHTVKQTNKPKKVENGVKVEPEVEELYEQEIPEYKLKLVAGKNGVLGKAEIKNAKDIKEKLNWLKYRIQKGIKETADVCKMHPPVCEGNLGISRDNMPQILEKSPKALLASDNEADKKAGKAAVDAGADPEDDKPIMTKLLDDLKKEGTKITKTKLPVGKLKATQSEILADKTYGMADAYLKGVPSMVKVMKDPLIISSDNHILDGHHRYSAMLTADSKYEMNVLRVGMPMKEFLMRAHEQPGVFRRDIRDNIISEDKPIDVGNGPKKIKRRKSSVNKMALDLVRIAKTLMREL